MKYIFRSLQIQEYHWSCVNLSRIQLSIHIAFADPVMQILSQRKPCPFSTLAIIHAVSF